ncbi:MAG: hypothetical protein K5989_04950, partial [Lachnospiraceae bacterium]|nr:hypothetical protein [Lachnospiraceae bacterium]
MTKNDEVLVTGNCEIKEWGYFQKGDVNMNTMPKGTFRGGEQDAETLPKGTFRGGEQDAETLPKGTFRGGEQDTETLPKGTFRMIVRALGFAGRATVQLLTNILGPVMEPVVIELDKENKFADGEENSMNRRYGYIREEKNGVANNRIFFATNVLDEFRQTVGIHRPETGGMLACSADVKKIDTWCFDCKSINTSASYSYDVEEMDKQFKKWKEKGIRSVGFVHSHPESY